MRQKCWSLFLWFALAAAAVPTQPKLYFNPPPRICEIHGEKTLLVTPEGCQLEIVAPREAGETVRYAGEELQAFLQRACEAKIPLLTARGTAKTAIVLGDNALFRQACPKIKLETLVRDGFYIVRSGGDIYIAGRDEKSAKIRTFLKSKSYSWNNHQIFERATLFGVYEFLERFLGVRFFFDGELGTVVPKVRTLAIPVRIRIMERPDLTGRKTVWWVYDKKQWYDDTPMHEALTRSYLRWRMESRVIPDCHGLAYLGYPQRFEKKHPEYFARDKQGKMYQDKQFPGQLCLTSKGLRNEIYEDVRSYLLGEDAKVRGIIAPGGTAYWPSPGCQPGFASIMMQDGCKPCQCPECQKYYAKGNQGGSNLVWEMTAEIAQRLKDNHVPGYVTQMGYHFYSVVPQVDLPDNVLMTLACKGPWNELNPSQKEDDQRIQDWSRKLNKKIALWNYSHNVSSYYGVAGMPHSTPWAVGNYYQRHKKFIYGVFTHAEADHFIWSIPNIYMATKVFWNMDANVDALMEDFCAKLFGKGAPELMSFFRMVERKWLENYRMVDTPLGLQKLPVSQFEVWEKIYPPQVLANMDGLFAIAEQKAHGDDMAIRRIRFFRKEYMDVMHAASKAFFKRQNDINEIKLIALERKQKPRLEGEIIERGRTAYLQATKGRPNDINVIARVEQDDQNLYVIFRCDEPNMKRLKISEPEVAKKNIWQDAVFEIFLNPSADFVNYFHVTVHPRGILAQEANPGAKNWPAMLRVRTHVGENFWAGEVVIPRNSLPEMKKQFPFNMCYNRQYRDEPMYAKTYSWSPFLKINFHDVDKFGLLSLAEDTDGNLVKNWNFDADMLENFLGCWYVSYPDDEDFEGVLEPDSSTFVSGGQSMHIGMKAGREVSLAQHNLPLKPNTTYLFSYWIKHDVKQTSALMPVVNAGQNFFMPKQGIVGKASWHRKTFTFKTPQQVKGMGSVRFFMNVPGGEAWIDNVRIEEVR